jgi:hypothetical protein
MGTVIGQSGLVDQFNEENRNASENGELHLPLYLYVCEDTGELYLGNITGHTKLADEVTSAVYADNADFADRADVANEADFAWLTDALSTEREICIDLGSNDPASFDGTSDVAPGVTGILQIENGGTGADNAGDACANIIDNQNLTPATITINGNQHVESDESFGIDMNGSDIVGANGIYFKDVADTAGEGINFARSDSSNKYDSLYSNNGKLYFAPNRGKNTNQPLGRYTVYHGGTDTAIPISSGGTGATSVASACANIINNQEISPKKVKVQKDAYSYESNTGSFGIDLNNSNLIGLNGLYFANAKEYNREGINFLRSNGNYDSIYALDGNVYLAQNRPKAAEKGSTDPVTMIHSGNISNYAAKIYSVYYDSGGHSQNQKSKVYISYGGPWDTVGNDYDIFIKL